MNYFSFFSIYIAGLHLRTAPSINIESLLLAILVTIYLFHTILFLLCPRESYRVDIDDVELLI